jgi:hypothetical protein
LSMAYVGILLITIFISFIIVRIGGFALQLTGIEPEVARFQALSAFSGTGFTTREAERVVGHRTRRRIVTILIILGNAGTVTVIATLVASFTQVGGYVWFFIRLAIIIAGIVGLYQLIIRSDVGQRILDRLQRPFVERILRASPVTEEIFHVDRDWTISLVTMERDSKGIGLSVGDVTKEGDIQILGINRAGAYLVRPLMEDKVAKGDQLLVYANRKAVKRILD